jgi:CheY-like chemotaxis protein
LLLHDALLLVLLREALSLSILLPRRLLIDLGLLLCRLLIDLRLLLRCALIDLRLLLSQRLLLRGLLTLLRLLLFVALAIVFCVVLSLVLLAFGLFVVFVLFVLIVVPPLLRESGGSAERQKRNCADQCNSSHRCGLCIEPLQGGAHTRASGGWHKSRVIHPMKMDLLEKRCVLIVDDDQGIRRLLVAFLRRQGFQLLEACNGREALAAMRVSNPDLVILDLWMPEVSGWEVLTERAADSSLQRIPVIVVTANSSRKSAADFPGKDVYAVIGKPFDLDALLTAVTTCLTHPDVPVLAAA